MEQLLKGLEPGLLARHVKPLLDRLHQLLASEDAPLEEIARRIRIIRIAARAAKAGSFEIAATAVLRRKRLHIEHWSRLKNEVTARTVSPQRLVYYRGNWYLDAWCHLRHDIRSFALDGIRKAELLQEPTKNVPEKDLDEVLSGGYGIFAGRATGWAKLRFSPQAARWVAYEKWHSKQKGKWLDDGAWLLEIPHSDDRELVMDILRYGPDVEVLEPGVLRKRVADAHRAALQRYSSVAAPDQEAERVVVRRAGRFTSEEVHRALFAKRAPQARSVEEMKEGIRRHMRKHRARD